MKKQIEDEIKRLKTERGQLIFNDIELSLIEDDDFFRKIYMVDGKIEALKWCLNLLINILNK